MRLSGDPRGVTFERLVAMDGDARIELEGRWAVPGGSYDFSFAGTRLALGRLGLPPEWQLTGTADAVLTVDGPAGDPRWRFEGTAAGAGSGGTVTDSTHLVLSGRPHALIVERGLVVADGGRLEGRQVFEGLAAAWPDSLVAGAVIEWLADADRWNGTWTAAAFPIDGWGALAPPLARAGGRLNGRVAVNGRPSRPELEARLSASPLSIDQFTLDSFDAEVRYRDERLEVPEARFARGDVVSTGSGGMALRLALGAPPELPERPMRWRVDAPGGDLSVLPLLVPQVAWAEGDFQMHATIAGTPRAPVLDGSLRIEHGQLRLSAREEVLRDLTASLNFDASRITLDTLTAYQGRSGALSGRGEVILDGFGVERYRFDLAMRDFTAIESGLYSATFDGQFTITDGVTLHGETLPHVTGDIEVLQATILLDFTDASAMQQFNAAEQPLFWTYRVHMRATDKLRWVPPNANIEFSADLILDQNVDSLSVFGDVDALRGQYWFFSNRFDVQRAHLQFDNVGGLDPQLDIEAITQLTPVTRQGAQVASDESGRVERQTISVRITGRSRNPVIEFDSSPAPLSQNVILEELTFGRYASGSGDFRDPFDDYLTRAINRQLSAEMSKLFQGYVSDWALTREYGGLLSGEGELYAEVGIPLNNQWQLRYRQRVPGAAEGEYSLNPFERDIEVEYRLNRFFYVTSEFAERKRAQSTTLTPEFNVNLKARWEY